MTQTRLCDACVSAKSWKRFLPITRHDLLIRGVLSSAVGGKVGTQPQYRNCDYLPIGVHTPFESSLLPITRPLGWREFSKGRCQRPEFHQVAFHLLLKLDSFELWCPGVRIFVYTSFRPWSTRTPVLVTAQWCHAGFWKMTVIKTEAE